MVQVYIEGLEQEEVLCALFNNAAPPSAVNSPDMDKNEAKDLLANKRGGYNKAYIGYHRGRRLNLEFPNPEGDNAKFINTTEYDRDYYQGPMNKGGEEVVRDLRFALRNEEISRKNQLSA